MARRAAPLSGARAPVAELYPATEDHPDLGFGDGRAELLERVERLGSFKKAVAEMGMSYRAAWGYFRELERAAGIQFLERHPGGGPAGGSRLTAEGKRFLVRYRRYRRGLDARIAAHFRRSFEA